MKKLRLAAAILLFVCTASAVFAAFVTDEALCAAGTVTVKGCGGGKPVLTTSTNIGAPSTPTSGKTAVWTDSTDKVLKAKGDSGTVSTTVVPSTAVSNQFVTGITSAGAVTRAQPTCGNLSNSGTGCSATLASVATSGSASDLGTGTLPNARLSASVSAVAGLTSAANKVPVFTGSGTAETRDDIDPTDVAYSSGIFTGSSSMTWTVESGDQSTFWYSIKGKLMTVGFTISTSSVGGTPARYLQLTIPLSKTASKAASVIGEYYQGTWTASRISVAASGSVVRIDKLDSANFASDTNGTYAQGVITFPIN